MPARKAPKAKPRKIWVHTFYLVQPLVQFVAIVAVILTFAGCSPLAPSSTRLPGLKSPGEDSPASSQAAEEAAREQAIQKSFQSVSEHALSVISESDYRQRSQGILHAEESLDERQVTSLRDQRRRHIRLGGFNAAPKLLVLPLSDQALSSLFRDGVARIDLNERLSRSQGKARKALYKLAAGALEEGELDASSYLVLSDAAIKRVQGAFDSLHVDLKISLAVMEDDQAFLEIRRKDNAQSASQDNAALLEAALREARRLAIVLE